MRIEPSRPGDSAATLLSPRGKLWLTVAALFCLTMLVVGNLPGNAQGLNRAFGDKVMHLGAYACLSGAIFLSLSRYRAAITLASITLLGGMDELIQSLFPYRSSDLSDLLTDLLAAALAIGAVTVASALSARKQVSRPRNGPELPAGDQPPPFLEPSIDPGHDLHAYRDTTHMKILMYCLNYAPELTGIGKYTSEQAEWLVAQGHEVRVITAPPYYPEWRIAEGYSASSYTREMRNGVTVLRAPLWVPRKPSGLKRLVHLATFAASTLPLLFWQARWKPDAVFIVEPPLFCSPATLLFGKVFGSKTWLHIQDFEVDAAFALGLLKSKRARQLVERVERWLLRKFDRVSTISQAMKRLAQAKGVDADRLVHFPNWVDVASIRPGVDGQSVREALGIPKHAIVALYSGNMGRKQGLEMLGEAAGILRHSEKIHFILCGHGPGKAELEKACEQLPRTHFLPLQPVERLPLLLASADIHLLPQRADAADLVMPSKLTGMLASGKAIVATAGDDTEVAHVVKGRGIVVAPGNSLALATAIQVLADDDALRTTYGAAARQYAETNLALDSLLARFEENLTAAIHESAVGGRPAARRS